jgi:hypothetical protein
MKSWKIITIATLSVLTVALLVSTVAAMGPFGSNLFGGYGGMMGGGYGGGMGGYGYGPYTNPQNPSQINSPNYQAAFPFQFGGGCIGRFGYSNYVAPNLNTGTGPITIDTAVTVAQNYVAALGNPDLTVGEVEEYTENFYVQVSEISTGNGAFELLINKYTGSIYPEMGPNMMWNTKYGMMRGGILSGIFGTPTTTMSITETQAETIAQQYLSATLPGTTVGDAKAFYGYYHVMVLSAGEGYGMLSVNGYNGQVWYHNWHGTFIQELEL